MSNMSSVVPFVMTPSGRFGDKACGLLLTMAKRAFGAERSAKGRWLTTWRNHLIATAVQCAALQLKKQTSTLTSGMRLRGDVARGVRVPDQRRGSLVVGRGQTIV